jgi:hypothetical protein
MGSVLGYGGSGTTLTEIDVNVGTKVFAFKSTGDLTVGGNNVWHAGNFDPSTKSDTTHNHNGSSPSFVQLTLTQADGTVPMIVTSKTKVANLNADFVDGYDFNQSLKTTDSPTFATLTLSGTGATPLTLNRTTGTSNVNMAFVHTASTMYLGIDGSGILLFGNNADLKTYGSTVWHSGNLTPANYLALAGGTMTGKITTPNAAMGIRLGDDAEIGDVNVANMFGVQGVQDATTGGIVFGSAKDTNIYRSAANTLKTDDALAIAGDFFPATGNIKTDSVVSVTTIGGGAQQIRVGSLLVSNAYSDNTKVPTNGAYVKGDISTDGKVSTPTVEVKSTSTSNKFTIEYNETENSLDFVFA